MEPEKDTSIARFRLPIQPRAKLANKSHPPAKRVHLTIATQQGW
jgi:hypothetical protein